MSERLVPDVLTPVAVPELYGALRESWRVQVHNEPTRTALILLLAHWALETAAGKACHCFNIGNAKHVTGDARDYCQFGCDEYVGGKRVVLEAGEPGTQFRAFDSLEAGAADYLAMLRAHFPEAWAALETGDVTLFCHRLKLRGYYTADESLYREGVARCMHTLEHEISALPEVASLARAALAQANLEIDISPDREPLDPPPDVA